MANRIKGITIEIDGSTTKLQDSLKEVDKSLKDTQANLKDVEKLLKFDPKNVTLLKQKQDLLTKAVDDTTTKLDKLKEAQRQMDAAGVEKNSAQYQALQREIVQTESDLKKFNSRLDETNTQLDKSNSKLEAFSQGAKKVSEGAQKVADKTKGLSLAAGAAGGAMLGMAAKAAASADDLLTLSNVTGFSVEELQKMQYASDRVDVSMETMTGSITKLTKNMASGADVFDQLGVAITDQDGNMRNATDVWYDAIEALGQIENETERDQVSMELFGKSAMEMAGIVDDGGAALKELGEEAEATGNILSQDAVEDAVAFNDQIDKLKATAEQAFLSAGAALADTLVPALETLVEVVSNVLSWFGNLDGSTQAFILTILGLVAAISPIAGIIAGISSMAAALNVAMLPMIGTIGAIVLAVGAVVAAGVALYQNWDTIKEKASEVWQSVTEKFDAIKTAVTDKINAAKDAVKSAIDAIKGFFNFDFKWPELKVPHFKVSGTLNPLNWLKDGLPKISVDWYAKAMNNGMILNDATIFGMRNGSLLGGGEAGSEVVVGTNSLRNMIQNAVGSNQISAPVSVNVTVNGNVEDSAAFARTLAYELSDLIKSESEVFG